MKGHHDPLNAYKRLHSNAYKTLNQNTSCLIKETCCSAAGLPLEGDRYHKAAWLVISRLDKEHVKRCHLLFTPVMADRAFHCAFSLLYLQPFAIGS